MSATPNVDSGGHAATPAASEEHGEQLEPSGIPGAAESYGPPVAAGLQRALHPRHTRSSRIPRPACGRARPEAKALPPAPAQRGKKDPFEQHGRVAILTDDGHELGPLAALIHFDTGSHPGNLISTFHLRTTYERYNIDKTYDTSAGVDLAVFVNGEKCQSLGTVTVRWYVEGFHKKRYEKTLCYVVESEDFELIIGKPDIIRLELFKPNRKWFGHINFFAVRPKVEVKSVTQQDETAEADRAREDAEQARFEEMEEEKAQLKREAEEKARRGKK